MQWKLWPCGGSPALRFALELLSEFLDFFCFLVHADGEDVHFGGLGQFVVEFGGHFEEFSDAFAEFFFVLGGHDPFCGLRVDAFRCVLVLSIGIGSGGRSG